MAEVQKERQFVLNFTNRKVNIRKSDFSDSKAEKQIFEFFEQNTQTKNFIAHTNFFQRVKLLDFGDDSEKVITEKEISEFLKKAKSQKTVNIGKIQFKTKMLKNVTEEDLIQFFNKVLELNPPEFEKAKRGLESGLKDEQGHVIFTDEIISNNFTNERSRATLFNVVDSDGNIKSGYEIFDLNDDGKIDNIEKKFWGEDFNITELQKNVNKIVQETGENKVLTADIKHNYYNNIESQYNTSFLNKLQTSSIKDSTNGAELVTNEVKHLFSAERKEISIDDIVDENGQIKKGLELFDINNDGKIDEIERNFFSNGGKYVNKGSDKITLGDFVNALTAMDQIDTKVDGKLSNKDKETIYLFAQGAYQMMDSLEEFPDDVRSLYEQALYSLSKLQICDKVFCGGYYTDNKIALKKDNTDKYKVASILFHELTHYICDRFSDGVKYKSIAQEVQAFYMQYKIEDKMPEGSGLRTVKQFEANSYRYLTENNPEITDLDIAKAVFKKTYYNYYSRHYDNKDPNVLENSKYKAIGSYFKEPDNKAQIYNAAIQKAFSGLSLKDENGKELITDELKNAFSADRPILYEKELMDGEKIKPGFEIFDFDSDGKLSLSERSYIEFFTYNDIPRLVETLKRFNKEVNNDDGDVISTQVRQQFKKEVIGSTEMRKKYDFHKIKN